MGSGFCYSSTKVFFWRITLSDQSGSFISGTTLLGNVTSTTATSAAVTIPATATASSNYRIRLEASKAPDNLYVLTSSTLKIGLPEVKLGLLPGGGGTQRVPRLVGIQQGMQLLTQGNEINVQKAKELGLVTDIAETKEELLSKSYAWILANPKAQQPWDQRGFKIPGGDPRHPSLVGMFAIAPSIVPL